MKDYTIDTTKSERLRLSDGVRQGDLRTESLRIHLTRGQKCIYLKEGDGATLYALLPDGTTVYDSCDVMDGAVIYPSEKAEGNASALTALPGVVEFEIKVYGTDGEVLTTPKLCFTVQPTLQNDDAIEAEPSFTALTDTLVRILAAEATINSKADRAWVLSYIEETFLGGEW